MFRRVCHFLYRLCGVAAVICLALIAVTTGIQIVTRSLGLIFEATELAGFLMAASTFLALAHTFVSGGHVRIHALLQFAPPRLRRLLELWSCAAGFAITGYATWYMGAFTFETFIYREVTPGLLSLPMWMPQAAMTFGLAIMCLAMIEQAILVLDGDEPEYESNIDSTAE